MAWNTANQSQPQFQQQQQQPQFQQQPPQGQQFQQPQFQQPVEQYQPPNPEPVTQPAVPKPPVTSTKALKPEELVAYIDRNYFKTRWHPAINLDIPADLFAYCRALPLTELVTKKEFKTRGGKPVSLDYMAWTDSLDQLRKVQPTWSAGCELNDETGLPYWATLEGYVIAAFVYDTVTGRRTPSIYLAVRDSKLSPVVHGVVIDAITNTMQRAIAKTIAQHTGIGWNVYAPDESIPDGSDSGVPDFGMYGAKPPMQPAFIPQQQFAQPQYPPMPQYPQEPQPEYSTQYQQQAPTFTRPTWGEGKMMT